ncbi:RNA-directed DNA polymerase, eukaryota, reverse transcriptase zinc-binding domain protein [Tanacetum coccineum]
MSPNDLWVKVVKGIHGQDGGIGCNRRSNSYQSTWIAILKDVSNLNDKGIDLLSACTRSVGNGVWSIIVLTIRHGVLRLGGCREKVNVFMWRLSLDKLATLVNLDRKGIDVASLLCPVCNEQVENVNHLFFSCEMARDLWTRLARWCQLNISEISNLSEWMSWLDACHILKKARLILEGIAASMLWSIWKFRNDLIFSVSKPKKALIWDSIDVIRSLNMRTKDVVKFSLWWSSDDLDR